MSREPRSNIGIVCEKHGPKPDPKLAKMKPEELVGCFVKKAFQVMRPDGQPLLEHMWVQVKLVDRGELVGKLDSDPQLITSLQCGDTVRVRMNELEEMCR